MLFLKYYIVVLITCRVYINFWVLIAILGGCLNVVRWLKESMPTHMTCKVSEAPGHIMSSPGTLCIWKVIGSFLREAVMTPFNYKHHPVCKEEEYTGEIPWVLPGETTLRSAKASTYPHKDGKPVEKKVRVFCGSSEAQMTLEDQIFNWFW